jgi:hypothetical protein
MPDVKKINVNSPQELMGGGVYANNMSVQHTKEEFILDFLMVAPPNGKGFCHPALKVCGQCC